MRRSRGTTTTSLLTSIPTSCDRLTPSPSATFPATTSVGFFSPRSSLEIIARLTPDRSARRSRVNPRPRRRALTRSPKRPEDTSSTMSRPLARFPFILVATSLPW
jgi:hypothetical protein